MHLKALKSYSIGDIIVKCEPLVYVICDEVKGFRCDYSFKINTQLKKCSKCKLMFYCDENCQKNDWVCHKLECTLFTRFRDQLKATENLISESDSFDLTFERLLIRLHLMIRNDSTIASKGFQLSDGREVSLNHVECNLQIFRSIPRKMIFFDYLCKRFHKFGIDFDKEVLFELFCYLQSFITTQVSNALDACIQILNWIKDEDMLRAQYSGPVCYPSMAFSHSCVPNACKVFNGNKLEIRAIKPIDINEEITICYVNLELPKSERQEQLKMLCIDCKCFRCSTSFDDKTVYSRIK